MVPWGKSERQFSLGRLASGNAGSLQGRRLATPKHLLEDTFSYLNKDLLALSVVKKVAFWSVVLFPAAIVCALALLIVTASYIIHISKDAEAYTRAVVPLQQLARHVYSRQLALWQSQMHCIVFDEVLFYKPRPG